jgi:multidrug efflux system outer membrane protein
MTRHNNLYRFALLMVLLTGCKVSKDLSSPKVELPKQFRNSAETTAVDSSSIADVAWKNFFTDATLQKLIDTAVRKNYDMQIAIKNIDAAALLFKQVKWNYVPALSLNVTANTSRPSDNSLSGLSISQYGIGSKHIEDYSANLSLSWEADIWGKIRNQQKSAVAAYLQSTEARKAVQTNLVATISQGYYNLLMLDAQMAIAEKNVKLSDSTLRIIQLQYDAGQVTSLAVKQAEAQKLAAAQLVPLFEKNISLQENALSILTSALPNRVSRSASLDAIVLPESLKTGLPSEILSRRPDVKSAELELVMANSRVGISKAQMYPALQITATGGLNSFKASNWFNVPASLFGLVGGSLLQPVLNHKVLKTEYQIAQVDREKTVLQFRQTVLNAVGEVSDALVTIDKLRAQQAIAASRVQALHDATRNANLLFKNGMATYLEVITAQSNVLQSELELATIKRDELNAVSDLYRSLGGGWN